LAAMDTFSILDVRQALLTEKVHEKASVPRKPSPLDWWQNPLAEDKLELQCGAFRLASLTLNAGPKDWIDISSLFSVNRCSSRNGRSMSDRRSECSNGSFQASASSVEGCWCIMQI
jgi:hypothetical protein